MKIDQTLIGSKIGPFADTRLAGSGNESLSGGVEEDGVDGVVVKISSQTASDAGRLRTPEPTAEGIFGVLATPQVYVPSGSLRVSEATGTAPSLRTSGLVGSAQTQEREGRGLFNTGNNPERLSPTSLFVGQDTPEREARPIRGETSFDTSVSGVDLNRSLAERPAQTLLNEGAGAPFGMTGSLPRQLGPNPTTGDGFGILSTSAGDATSFREESLQPRATGPSGPLGGVNMETESAPGIGLIDPPRQTEPEASALGSFAPNSLVSEIGIPGNEEQDQSSVIDEASLADSREEESSLQGIELSQAEEEIVRQLQSRDREVREHEQAHVAAAGGLAGSPTYAYTSGPDNRQYAVGGEVAIDVSEGGSPEETVEKARTIQRAALAPADPSGQDRAVAAAAARMELNALQDIRDQSIEEAQARAEGAESVQNEATVEVQETENAQEVSVAVAPTDGASIGIQTSSEVSPITDNFPARGPERSGGTLPQEQSTSVQAREALRPNMTTEVFQELRVARESVESREITAGAASRGVSDYQRSENAFQGQDDYISVA